LFEGLTNREFQILCLFAEGLSVDDIAQRLGLSSKTIANYLTLIKDKLQVGSAQELVRLAISKGLVTL
jgi:two-component system invasion response regulator UvrY